MLLNPAVDSFFVCLLEMITIKAHAFIFHILYHVKFSFIAFDLFRSYYFFEEMQNYYPKH